MSSGLVASAAEPAAAAATSGHAQEGPDTAELARQLGVAVMLLGRLGLGAGRQVTRLLALNPASGEPDTPALCEAALAAIEALPRAEPETQRANSEQADSPREQMAAAAAAAGLALAASGEHARASMAPVPDRQGNVPEANAQPRSAALPAETPPLAPTREPSAPASDAQRVLPPPAPVEEGRPANIEGMFVQCDDNDSVWRDLVAETKLWRRFEVPDEVPDEVFRSVY